MKKIIGILLIIMAFTSCREKMMIDMQDGDMMVGISGSITDEYKKQEVILSRTTPFYTSSQPERISDATVFVTDGTDTIWYEESDEAGLYLSKDSVAGAPNHTYRLSVDFIDDNGNQHFYAESTMKENVEEIDSIRIKPWKFNSMEVEDMLGVYPYFQTTDDPKTYYMIRVAINGDLVSGDTIHKCTIFETLGYAGIYFNGPFMTLIAGEFPVYGLNQKKINEVINPGDTLRMDLWSIPRDYAHYLNEIANSNGTNPMMGTPSNVRTNIYPEGTAVGMFHASSLRQHSVIY